jgi:uracil DNA glycosylase
LIDKASNKIIKDAHPSPLGGAAFNDTTCFTAANAYLKEHGRSEVNWQIT